MWEKNAKKVAYKYGTLVDWKKKFYICPKCGKPVFKCDWFEYELWLNLCPICGFDGDE